MAARRRAHLRIHGRVQGVNFRWYARRHAEMLGIAGWIRNCPDGTVEVVAQGDPEAVGRFVDWAHRGPSMARVERVDVESDESEEDLQGFRIVE